MTFTRTNFDSHVANLTLAMMIAGREEVFMTSRPARKMRRSSHLVHLVLWSVLALLMNAVGAVVMEADAGATAAPISGTGSSFASPAIET